MKAITPFRRLLEPLDDEGASGVVPVFVETPKAHRNKYKYEPDLGLFTLGGVLPAGAVFPYDFGFVPYTRAEDGADIEPHLRKEIERFFIDYNEQKGRKFRPLGWFGPGRAIRLVKKSRKEFDKSRWPALPSPSVTVQAKSARQSKPESGKKKR